MLKPPMSNVKCVLVPHFPRCCCTLVMKWLQKPLAKLEYIYLVVLECTAKRLKLCTSMTISNLIPLCLADSAQNANKIYMQIKCILNVIHQGTVPKMAQGNSRITKSCFGDSKEKHWVEEYSGLQLPKFLGCEGASRSLKNGNSSVIGHNQ